MAINLTIRGGTPRSFPQPGDTDLFGEVTNWANDVTTAVNQSPTTSTSASYDAIVGTAANVSAGLATHSDIASAIAAVSANDRIFILENTYEPSAQIDINKALTIIGQGEGAVIEGDNIAAGAVVKISASGVTFENCKIIQGSGTPDYALEVAAALQRINLNLKADGTFATNLFLNGSGSGAVTGFISYDTSSFLFADFQIPDSTTSTYNLKLLSDSDGTALTADRTLTFDVNNANRIIDLSADFTVGAGFTVTITSEDTNNSIVLDEQNFEVEGEGTAQQLLKLVNASNAAATLTIDGTSGAINQDVQTTASPTFVGPVVQKITRDSADITVETTTSGDVVLKAVSKNVIFNKADATNANTHTFKFGDDTGGISGIRNNSGALELNSSGGGWVDAATYVTLAGTETLTNKTLTSPTINTPTVTSGSFATPDINGADINIGTASNSNRIVLPTDTTTNLDLLTDTAGLIAYDSTLSKVVFNNGGGWNVLDVPSNLTVVTKTTTYTATTSDDVILVDSTSGAFTVTLYAASGNAGAKLTFIKISSDTNAVTIDGNASETINGNTTTTVDTQYEKLTLVCDGTNWLVDERKSDTAYVSFTPTGAWSTNTTYAGKWRRLGDSMQIEVSVTTSGAPDSANLTVNVPSGYTIDTAKVSANTVFRNQYGVALLDGGSRVYTGNAAYSSASDIGLNHSESGNFGTVNQAAPFTFGAGNGAYFNAIVPISGWKAANE